MKHLATIFFLLSVARAVEVPFSSTGNVARATVSTFTALRFDTVLLSRSAGGLTATVTVTPLPGPGVSRTLVFSDAQLAAAVPHYPAVKAGVLALLPPWGKRLTATVDAHARISVYVPTLQDGAWRLVLRDEDWLVRNGVDCGRIRVGVAALLGKAP